MSIAADAFAAVPTLVKSFADPGSEHPAVFRNSAVNAVITLLTIRHWSYAAWGFPVWILIVCAGLWMIIQVADRTAPTRPSRPLGHMSPQAAPANASIPVSCRESAHRRAACSASTAHARTPVPASESSATWTATSQSSQ